MKKKLLSAVLAGTLIFSGLGATSASASMGSTMQKMSSYAYKDTKKNINSSWKFYKSYDGFKFLGVTTVPMQYKVYRKKVSKKSKQYYYAVAYAGSKDAMDYASADYVEIRTGLKGTQVYLAENKLKSLLKSDKSKIKKLYLTGHSLGGYLAAFLASDIIDDSAGLGLIPKSKVKAYTFNAPGISKSIFPSQSKLKILRDKQEKYDNYILNYYIKKDVFSAFGDNLGKRKGFKNPTKDNPHRLSNFTKVKL